MRNVVDLQMEFRGKNRRWYRIRSAPPEEENASTSARFYPFRGAFTERARLEATTTEHRGICKVWVQKQTKTVKDLQFRRKKFKHSTCFSSSRRIT